MTAVMTEFQPPYFPPPFPGQAVTHQEMFQQHINGGGDPYQVPSLHNMQYTVSGWIFFFLKLLSPLLLAWPSLALCKENMRRVFALASNFIDRLSKY